MPGKAMNKKACAIASANNREQRIERAVRDWEHNILKPAPDRLSMYAFAKKHNIVYETLRGRIRGTRQSSKDYHASRQKLSPIEERVLVDHIMCMADRAMPLSNSDVIQVANKIIDGRGGTNFILSQSGWIDTFLARHRDEIKSHWGKSLDMQRAQALNPSVVTHWFTEIVGKHMKDRETGEPVEADCTYGMDESGFPRGHVAKTRVIGRRETKTQHQTGGGNRENVTVIVTICADGTKLVPTIIFKGKQMRKAWTEGNLSGASFSISENGWTDNEIALGWIEDFEKQTAQKANGRTRVLFVDGHKSHLSPEFLRYASDHNIEVLGYPPHCTHALQGLDVACFGRLKEIWKQLIHEFEAKHNQEVEKADFTLLFGQAFLKAMTAQTIRAAFQKTGIHPYNPNVISENQMKPSEGTSVKQSLPVQQPSPVRAISASLYGYQVTPMDLDPENYAGIAEGRSNPQNTSGPHFPRKRRFSERSDENLDPLLSSPSKRARQVIGALASTSSGRSLVDETPITASHPLPIYVLEYPAEVAPIAAKATSSPSKMNHQELVQVFHEQREVIRKQKASLRDSHRMVVQANATIITQDLYCRKVSSKLNAKETKKMKDKTVVPTANGFGRYWTDPEIIGALEEEKAAKAEEERSKGRRRAEKEARAAKKREVDKEWTEEKARFKEAKETYIVMCSELLGAGKRKKDLPPPPKRVTRREIWTRYGLMDEDERDGDEVEERD